MPSEHTMERYLSIADLSRLLGLPESTTRYYCKRFASHLPHTGEGRKRRYAPESEAILRTVMAEMRRSKNAFAVDMALSDAAAKAEEETSGNGYGEEKAAMVPSGTPSLVQNALDGGAAQFSVQVLSLMERQTQALQEIAAAMALFVSHHPAHGREENNLLREELSGLREAMRLSEEKQTKDLEQTRKWLARFSEALAKR